MLIAVEPPLSGRPADYGGAVGDLRVAARLDTVGSRVGDPMTLTLRVSGTGNVKLFPRPAFGLPWASLVKGDERVQVDTAARRIAGAKEFDWVLTPRIAGELDLPLAPRETQARLAATLCRTMLVARHLRDFLRRVGRAVGQ